MHNTAVAEYVAGGCREPRKLLSTLEALKQRLEDARSVDEFGEGENLRDADTDPSLTVYNMAVLLYQLKQYARCRTLLEDMFSNIEPIDEFLAFKLCFLLLDVYLLYKQAERAADVLSYLEKSFAQLSSVQNGVDGGEAVTPSGGEPWPNKKSTRRAPTEITPEEVRSTLNLYKAKLALMSRASSKREIKTTLSACAQNTTGLFLKGNLEWQRQNYRKAIKLLNNSCQVGVGERDKNLPALYFNNLGCIHHCMRRHQVASFYFGKALQENESLYKPEQAAAVGEGLSLQTFSCDRRCEIAYNRGLQQLLSGRPADAFKSFVVALELYHSSPRVWLRIGEACVALHVQQQKKSDKETGAKSVSPLVAAIAHGGRIDAANGGGGNRFLVLPTDGPSGAGRDGAGPPAEDSDAPISATMGSPSPPSPTLPFAVKALRNAVLQCGQQLGAAQLSSLTAAEYANLLTSASNGTLSSTDEHAMQLHTVQRLSLLHLSWCALTLDDYVPAFTWASQLLGLEACPNALKAYANLYACDALCHLNRIDEAMEHLTAAIELNEPLTPVASSTGAETATTAASDADGMECVRNPYSPLGETAAAATAGTGGGAARATLYTNLAVVHTLQGDTKSAEGYAQQALSQQPANRRALLCCVYLELAGGRTEAAIELLKKQRMPQSK